VIPLRALNPDEALPALVAVADVLDYLHGRRFLHGHLKPANIMAAGEKVKISSDSICEVNNCCSSGVHDAYTAPEYGAGMTPAVDIWSLGMTLTEVLTQSLPAIKDANEPSVPATLPQPFFDVVRHSLRRDPRQRWTAEEIRTRLNSSGAKPASAKVSERAAPETKPEPMRSRPRYLIPVLAIAALVIILLVLAFRRHPAAESASTPGPAVSKAQRSATPAPPKPSPSRNTPGSPTRSEGVAQPGSGRILTRVMPAVAPSAMRTISGHFRITVRAIVDSDGNVSEAKFVSRGPSQYFARLSMDAAKQWKFAPAMVNGRPTPSQWLIQFGFSRTGINDSAEEQSP
jgi:serine/threonine protein kinase